MEMPIMSDLLSGKVAVVTGGSEGIGLGICRALANAGAKVFLTGRREAQLLESAKAVGHGAVPITADCANLRDLDRLFERVTREAGRIDVLVANAGIAGGQALGAITEESFDRMIDVNLKGLVFTVQGALPLIPAGGAILLLSSTFASKGGPSSSIYSATKAAIRSLAGSWIVDLKERRIRVNVISPGVIETPGLFRLFPDEGSARQVLAHLGAQTTVGRVGTPADIGATALFLLSRGAAFINGADIQVDGGAAQI
jgi:NAD(P)-dependent dehydrogenase (short-subunit alcohol dehydrogenase family)